MKYDSNLYNMITYWRSWFSIIFLGSCVIFPNPVKSLVVTSPITSSNLNNRFRNSRPSILWFPRSNALSKNSFNAHLIRTSAVSNTDDHDRSPSPPLRHDNTQLQYEHVPITEIDMRYNFHTPLTYDPAALRFVSLPRKNKRIPSILSLASYLKHAFLPSSVTPAYYTYIRWRILQRYVNAVVHVLGTQSLIIGLGLKSTRVGFASASTTWICKDALGKVARMLWASKMGQRFDSDAKRWRFRSSLVFAFGNGLEICALAFPKWFLLWATLSNAAKQISMLTSSATRNALYNSFSLSEGDTSYSTGAHSKKPNQHPTTSSSSTTNSTTTTTPVVIAAARQSGGGENIGDITAKGEAQIAVVDLIGIASGICLSKIIGVSVKNVLSAWILLQVCEIACMYKEINAVVFRVLNYERMWSIVDKFVSMIFEEDNGDDTLKHEVHDGGNSNKKRKKSLNSRKEKAMREFIPTPMEMASQERIFFPPERLARRSTSFGSFGRTELNPTELKAVMDVFKGDKFLLIVGHNVKKGHRHSDSATDVREHCHVVLHKDATNMDIVKSTLALGILRSCLASSSSSSSAASSSSTTLRTGECLDTLAFVKATADEWFPRFLKTLQKRGWATPARFMFGKVTMRADWPVVSTFGAVASNTTSSTRSNNTINSHNSRDMSVQTNSTVGPTTNNNGGQVEAVVSSVLADTMTKEVSSGGSDQISTSKSSDAITNSLQ